MPGASIIWHDESIAINNMRRNALRLLRPTLAIHHSLSLLIPKQIVSVAYRRLTTSASLSLAVSKNHCSIKEPAMVFITTLSLCYVFVTIRTEKTSFSG